jgi:hypothetical protein
MTTYTIVQYDITRDVMYFLGAPTPGLKTLIENNSLSDTATKQVIQGDSSTQNGLVPASGSAFLLDFLENDVPEIDLNNAISVTLKIGIVDDTEVGDVYVICKNQDGTTTYVTKDGLTWDVVYVDILKPSKKWPTMNKNCPTCLKFDFVTGSNAFNFYGNLGGSWTGNWKNNQKEYNFFLPDYSNALTYGAIKEYIIYWKPSASYSGTDYNGNPISIVNEHKWVAVPSASINLPFTTESFFQVTSGFSASCPTYDASPLTPPWWNFYGPKGYFLLSSVTNPTPGKPCPEFSPVPGQVNWGYYCGLDGCVAAPSGSISGSIPANWYPTLEQCQVSCSLPPTSSWYVCTGNGCIPVPSGSAGAFVTLAECEENCSDTSGTPTSCSCDPDLSPVTNPSFALGQTGWISTPSQYLPGVGSWDFSQGYAAANTQSPFSNSNTSSVSLTQANLFTISCSYEVCFQAWNLIDSPLNEVTVNTGNYTTNIPPGTGPLTTTPTAYTFTLNNVETTDLTFFVGTGASTARVAIDNVCVTLIGCPPPTPPSEGTGSVIPPEDCYITGSISSYVSASYDCLCPEGYTSDGSGSCVQSGSLIINAISAITSSINASPLSSTPIQGYSILQNPAGANQFIAGWNILKASGLLQPILYYDWNFNGTGDSSIGNLSPFSGSDKVYNTQYTFDILSSSFWYEPNLPDNSTNVGHSIQALPMRWVASLLRQAQLGNYYYPNVGSIVHFDSEDRWSGFGTTLNVPSNKTYYVGIIGQGAMQIKLDGNTILRTSPIATQSYPLNLPNFPAYYQNLYSRYGEWPNGTLNFGVLAPPLYSLNNYLSNDLTGACIDYMTTPLGIECPPGIIINGTTQKLSSVFNLYIYPVTMSAGCHKINFEVNTHDSFKYCNSQQASLGAVIFDMTATQIVSASSYNDLNILWDSTYLDAIDYNGNYNGPNKPRYMYSYDISLTPSASFYTSLCPTGSTAIGGNPCNGCQTTQSANLSIPCGNCLECTHGLLYNGYVVDKGGATLQGRGPGGIVNTATANVSTWVIPTESDWNSLVTFLNGGTAPVDVTITGSLGTISGGKLKDYTRDLEATCWENPNIGAQTDLSSSGWAGTAGGRRKDNGVFEGLGFEGLWWSANSLSTPPITNGALMAARRLEHYSADVFRDIFPKSYGCSIRLVRPATTGETNGMFIPDAYLGKNGTLYDGIVINDQVWITKNLSETLYNNNTAVSNTTSNTIWDSTLTNATPTSCYYNNDATNSNILNGNVNPLTQECYTFPTYYVYEKCDGSEFLVQPVSGSTTTVGKVLKDSNYDCWSFFGTSTGIPTYPHTYSATNYFSGSNYIYNNCNECEAIHTIYMKFGTKNC